MNLTERDEELLELMDDPSCDERRLQATYRRFGTINRLISAWGGVYRTLLRPHLTGLGRPARVLDLGCGGGDVVTRLATLADRDGLAVSWVGADPDPRAHEAARLRGTGDVEFRVADSTELIAAGERFDAVISNHVLHHLSRASLRAFTDDSRMLSAGPVLHADIARGRLAYGLYAIGITPFAPGTFLRTDGLRSIRRSYRADELAAALPEGWSVNCPAPFRLVAVADGLADA
ncbi:methyltransferase domain-containing protein [Microbacterium rhizomatis]|uniref:Methyltransferase domain-containing protein n=1 Tax=Microbacterium rhizomatis TaxID=1631477 RepID=A0A5J5J1H3_9MICO|nr:methyltransferase domain-containing protein [Microbacterium rhizomatis]KAA9108371.1 methyltransferase domain-containing protein [Microbacterium rhizomatis]